MLPAGFARLPIWRRWFGRRAERAAASYLRRQGCRILGRNVGRPARRNRPRSPWTGRRSSWSRSARARRRRSTSWTATVRLTKAAAADGRDAAVRASSGMLWNVGVRFDVIALGGQPGPRTRGPALPSCLPGHGSVPMTLLTVSVPRPDGQLAMKIRSTEQRRALIRRGSDRSSRATASTAEEARTEREDRQAAAGQVRHRPDRHRRPPRAHGPPAEAAAVPGPRPPGGAHHRQLHGPGRRPERPRPDAGPPHPRAGREERRGLPDSRSAGSSTWTEAEVRPERRVVRQVHVPRHAEPHQQDHRPADAGAGRLLEAVQGASRSRSRSTCTSAFTR